MLLTGVDGVWFINFEFILLFGDYFWLSFISISMHNSINITDIVFSKTMLGLQYFEELMAIHFHLSIVLLNSLHVINT